MTVDVTGEVQSRTATTTVPVPDVVVVRAPGIATTSLRSIITLLRTPMMMLQRSSTGRIMRVQVLIRRVLILMRRVLAARISLIK